MTQDSQMISLVFKSEANLQFKLRNLNPNQ